MINLGTSLDKLSAVSPETNLWFFHSYVIRSFTSWIKIGEFCRWSWSALFNVVYFVWNFNSRKSHWQNCHELLKLSFAEFRFSRSLNFWRVYTYSAWLFIIARMLSARPGYCVTNRSNVKILKYFPLTCLYLKLKTIVQNLHKFENLKSRNLS